MSRRESRDVDERGWNSGPQSRHRHEDAVPSDLEAREDVVLRHVVSWQVASGQAVRKEVPLVDHLQLGGGHGGQQRRHQQRERGELHPGETQTRTFGNLGSEKRRYCGKGTSSRERGHEESQGDPILDLGSLLVDNPEFETPSTPRILFQRAEINEELF